MIVITIMEVFVKFATETLATGQIIVLRSLMAFALLLPVAWYRAAMRPWRMLLSAPVALRLFAEAGAATSYIYALASLPIANIATIVQVAPLLVMAAAVLFLGERVGWRRWFAALCGLAGVLLIIRPWSTQFDVASLFAVISVGFLVLRDLATRRIKADVPTLFVALATTVAVLCGGLLLAMTEIWRTPDGRTLTWLLAAGACQAVFYLLAISAFRTGEASVVAPFRYTKVVWALLAGYAVFGTFPDALAFFGMVIILAAGLYVFWREQVRREPTTERARRVSEDLR